MLKVILQKLGLSDKDAVVYIACLEMGTQPASIIARKTGLKRPTTYVILDGLAQQGLVSEYTAGNAKYFTAVSPEYLVTLLEKRRRELESCQDTLEQILPKLESIGQGHRQSPRVRFFNGTEGIIQVLEECLTARTPILCYTTMDLWFSRDPLKRYIEEFITRRITKYKIPLRMIVPETNFYKNYLEYSYPKNDTLTEVHWTPGDIPIFTSDISIFDNKIAMCTLSGKEELGIIIESDEIARTHRAIFELAWRSSNAAKQFPKRK